jgi:alpha-tubulin suppressor-like RCC1 family protein
VPRRESRRAHRSSLLAARASVDLLFFACIACGRTDIVDGWTNAGAHGGGGVGGHSSTGGAHGAGTFGSGGAPTGGAGTGPGPGGAGKGGSHAGGSGRAGAETGGTRPSKGGAGGFAGNGGRSSAGAGGRAPLAGSSSGGAGVGGIGGSAGGGICGDGRVSPNDESCDLGASNGAPGSDCSATCRVRARELAAGEAVSCAIGYNADVKCWGYGLLGALGQGDTNDIGDEPGQMGSALAPIDLNSDPNVFRLAAGGEEVCTVTLGGVRCWGYDLDGELGLGDTQTRGDHPNELGSFLPFIDLGRTFLPTDVAVGTASACAVSSDFRLKCWGRNLSGELGLGDIETRGDTAGEMGDALPAVDLGTGVKVSQVALGESHTCALTTDGKIKCWGANWSGQLGLGDTLARGDAPGEMGDALPYVDLGTGQLAKKVVAAGSRTCALLGNQTLKCWGDNSEGMLGLGDVTDRGKAPGQMGDALPSVDLGTGRGTTDVAMGEAHTCAEFSDGSLKCWGMNDSGQLGVPSVLSLGSTAGEMGDNLPETDLGDTVDTVATGGSHTCAKLHTSGVVKCWGGNANGALGLGDTQDRGFGPDDMGSNLPAVDVDF